MDPLSIIASTIAIATPVIVCLRKVRDNRNAKTDLSLLEAEVMEVVLVLQELDQSLRYQSRGPAHHTNARLLHTLNEAKTKLNDLSLQILEWNGKPSVPKPSMTSGPKLWLMIGSKVNTFHNELQRIRFQLMTLLSMMNLSGTTRIETNLHDFASLTRDFVQQQSIAHDRLRDDISKRHDRLESRLAALPGQHTTANVVASATPPASETSEESAVVPSTSVEMPIRAFHHNGSILFDSAQVTAIAAVGIRTVQFPRTSCTPWCSCQCHREYRIRSPRCLDQFFGSLYIGHSGIPMLSSPCNERSCHLKSHPLTYMAYFFPRWLLSRMATFMMTVTPLAGPVASLKVQRTVSGTADIFTCAKLGDVDGMKALFRKGLASPHDVHFESGITALHMAINHQHVAVCKLLLQTNADPFLSDFTECTAADSAWTKILSRCLESDAEQELRQLFSETECVERRGFSVLHKVVLGLVDNSLEEILRASTADIDVQDSIGRTPLSMAVERSNIEHARLLLDSGADVDLASYCNQSPLHYAASAKKPDCVALLLQAGAQVDFLTNWNQSPLHLAAAYTRDPRHATLLLSAGSDYNRRDRDGMTPLHWTAISNNVEVASVLLGRADLIVEDLDYNGSSTLSQCIRSNRHAILGSLVGTTPRVTRCFRADENVWDLVATSADVETLRLLKGADWVDVTTDLRLERGDPIFDVILERSSPSQDLVSAFRDLYRQVMAQQTDLMPLQCDVEEDVWADAEETQ